MSKNDQIIKNLDIDDNAKEWILSMSDGFKFQFLVYFIKIGHTLEKSIYRAMSEFDEIALEKDYRINEIINNENINDCEKINLIKELVED